MPMEPAPATSGTVKRNDPMCLVRLPDASQTRHPALAVADIGAFVAALIERRDQVFHKRFDLAGDELSGEEQAKILSQAIGRPINYQEIPIAAARQQSEDVAIMFEWFDRVGADADIAALRRDFAEVRWHSFADWAREFDWSVATETLVSQPSVRSET